MTAGAENAAGPAPRAMLPPAPLGAESPAPVEMRPPTSNARVARHSALVVLNSVLGAGLGYVALLAMARYMGAELYGARQFALSAIFLIGVVTRLGFPITHARRLARGDDIAASTGTYLALKVGLTALFLAVASVAAFVWFVLLDKTVTDTTPTALTLAAVVVVAQSLRDVAVNSFRGLGRIVERESVLLTNTLLTASLAVLVALAFAGSHGRWTPLGAGPWAADLLAQQAPMGFERALALLLGGFLVGDAAALGLALVLFLRSGIPVAAPRREILRDYWRATLPLMVLSVAGVAATRMNHLLLGFWYDNRELGLYAAALKLNEILMLLPNGVAIALLPAVARLDRGGESTRLHDLMVQTERWVSMLLWPAVVLVALQPQAVIRILLSNAFLAASPILIILALQALISSLRIPLQTKALGLGQHKVAARVAVTALAVDLVLAVLLIPERIGPVPLAALGAKGAALAALAAAAFTLIAYRVQAKEWTGHPYFSRHLLRHAVAGISTYVACRLVLPYMGLMPAARFWELMLVGIVVLGVYIGYIALTGEVRKGEIRAIFRAVVKRRRPA